VSARRVLVVGDDELVFFWLARALAAEPRVEVTTAATAKEPLVVLAAVRRHLRFPDIRLAGASGLELLGEAADYLIPKPFDPTQVPEVAGQALA